MKTSPSKLVAVSEIPLKTIAWPDEQLGALSHGEETKLTSKITTKTTKLSNYEVITSASVAYVRPLPLNLDADLKGETKVASAVDKGNRLASEWTVFRMVIPVDNDAAANFDKLCMDKIYEETKAESIIYQYSPIGIGHIGHCFLDHSNNNVPHMSIPTIASSYDSNTHQFLEPRCYPLIIGFTDVDQPGEEWTTSEASPNPKSNYLIVEWPNPKSNYLIVEWRSHRRPLR